MNKDKGSIIFLISFVIMYSFWMFVVNSTLAAISSAVLLIFPVLTFLEKRRDMKYDALLKLYKDDSRINVKSNIKGCAITEKILRKWKIYPPPGFKLSKDRINGKVKVVRIIKVGHFTPAVIMAKFRNKVFLYHPCEIY